MAPPPAFQLQLQPPQCQYWSGISRWPFPANNLWLSCSCICRRHRVNTHQVSPGGPFLLTTCDSLVVLSSLIESLHCGNFLQFLWFWALQHCERYIHPDKWMCLDVAASMGWTCHASWGIELLVPQQKAKKEEQAAAPQSRTLSLESWNHFFLRILTLPFHDAFLQFVSFEIAVRCLIIVIHFAYINRRTTWLCQG